MAAFLDEAVPSVAGRAARWIRLDHMIRCLALSTVGRQRTRPSQPHIPRVVSHIGPSDAPHGAVFRQLDRRSLSVGIEDFRH